MNSMYFGFFAPVLELAIKFSLELQIGFRAEGLGVQEDRRLNAGPAQSLLEV